ncbi:hypothetical protein DW757_14855 [Clostridium sp. AM29-11AC]|nr:hypothetical protein DW757_14855 [Clostridium sp. AM29-11AC]
MKLSRLTAACAFRDTGEGGQKRRPENGGNRKESDFFRIPGPGSAGRLLNGRPLQGDGKNRKRQEGKP